MNKPLWRKSLSFRSIKNIILFIVIYILLMLQYSTTILIERYRLVSKFGRSDDQIYEKVLLDNKILESYRFFVPINHTQRESRYNALIQNYFRLVSNISLAVYQERRKTNENLTFSNYTISAYVWSTLNPQELPELVLRLGYQEKYDNYFIKMIYKEMALYKSVMPFCSGEQVIGEKLIE